MTTFTFQYVMFFAKYSIQPNHMITVVFGIMVVCSVLCLKPNKTSCNVRAVTMTTFTFQYVMLFAKYSIQPYHMIAVVSGIMVVCSVLCLKPNKTSCNVRAVTMTTFTFQYVMLFAKYNIQPNHVITVVFGIMVVCSVLCLKPNKTSCNVRAVTMTTFTFQYVMFLAKYSIQPNHMVIVVFGIMVVCSVLCLKPNKTSCYVKAVTVTTILICQDVCQIQLS